MSIPSSSIPSINQNIQLSIGSEKKAATCEREASAPRVEFSTSSWLVTCSVENELFQGTKCG